MDERHEYDDAFNEGDSDNNDDRIRNDYPAGTAGWHGYEAGWRAAPAAPENWDAQAAYDERNRALPELPSP